MSQQPEFRGVITDTCLRPCPGQRGQDGVRGLMPAFEPAAGHDVKSSRLLFCPTYRENRGASAVVKLDRRAPNPKVCPWK
jgi:hypothetical protein